MTLNYAEIAEIIKLIDASSCEEITLDLDEIKLSVRRKGASGPAQVSISPTQQLSSDAIQNDLSEGSVKASATGDAITPGPSHADTPDDGTLVVRSPMVGTYYQAPSPTSPPFVEVGSIVKEDDPLCLIEVMKLYTTISATGPGRVKEICAENGAMVDANEVLFRIEPF